jgi:hypothetical protein
MPTYLRLSRFNRDWDRLSAPEQAHFRAALAVFVADLVAGNGPGLRVKKMAGHDLWEMAWRRMAEPLLGWQAGEGRRGAHHLAAGRKPSDTYSDLSDATRL